MVLQGKWYMCTLSSISYKFLFRILVALHLNLTCRHTGNSRHNRMSCHCSRLKMECGQKQWGTLFCHTNGLLLRHRKLCSLLTMATDDRNFDSSQCPYLPLFPFYSEDECIFHVIITLCNNFKNKRMEISIGKCH